MTSFTYGDIEIGILMNGHGVFTLDDPEIHFYVSGTTLKENFEAVREALKFASDEADLFKVGFAFSKFSRWPKNVTSVTLARLALTGILGGESWADLRKQALEHLEAEFGLSALAAPVPATKNAPGFVYLAYCDTGHYKIGRSITPYERIQHFDTQMPVTVSLVHHFPCDNAAWAEESLHYIFQECRHKGE